ncbi:MAG: LLM class flavin-dependent oxidoreductase [Thermodesulfobacteriota bacterium]
MKITGLILDAVSIKDLKELAVKAEISNFHSVWATELYRTPFQQLAAASSVTKNIKLGTAVALAFARSPLVTALTTLDLDELSGGRTILGLGTGAKNTNERYHGIKFGKPVKRIRECINIINHYLSSSNLDKEYKFDGDYYEINTKGYNRAFKPIRENIPIFLAGIGENMIRTSAEVTDGYLGHVVCSFNYLNKIVKPEINKGLREKNKKRSKFTVASIITCAVTDNYDEAKNAVKATIGFYATVKTYRKPFVLAGFADQLEKIRNAYFNKNINDMIKNVPDEMVEEFAVIGDEDYCKEKIYRYRDIIDLPILSAPHYFIDFEQVKKYQNRLLKVFGE